MFRSNYSVKAEANCWVALVLFCALYFIAGSIGSGWMFLLAATVLVGALAGLVVPWLILMNTHTSAHCPGKLTADQPFDVKVKVAPRSTNSALNALLTPRFLLLESSFQGTRRGTIKSADWLIEGAEHATEARMTYKGLPRGVFSGINVQARTCFPFGFFWHKRTFRFTDRVTVYPYSCNIEGRFLYQLRAFGCGAFGVPKEGSSAQSTFTKSVRDYVRGDSPRNIHWKSAARLGKLMVREFDAEGMPYFDVQLDLTANWQKQDDFELAVSAAATLLALGQRMGLGSELILVPPWSDPTKERSSTARDDGLGLAVTPLPGFEYQMEVLARVQPAKSNGPTSTASKLRKSSERTTISIVPAGADVASSDDAFTIFIGKTETATLSLQSICISSIDELAEL